MGWKKRKRGTGRQRGKPFKTGDKDKSYKEPPMKTMFFPAKYKKYEEIVSLKSPKEARESAVILKREFREAKTRDKKRRVKRVTVLAGNRAFAMGEKKDLSSSERSEFKQIGKIYGDASLDMELGEV